MVQPPGSLLKTPPPDIKEFRRRRASDLLLDALNGIEHGDVTIQYLLDSLRDRAYGIILLLFALPNCVPMPPGLASIVGIPLIFFGVQLALGEPKPWLPRFLAQKSIDRDRLTHFVEKAVRTIFKRIEFICRPRLIWFAGPRAERAIGALVALFGVSVTIPMPFTNFLPALGVAIISLGLLEEDGAAVIAGILVGIFGIAVTLTILFSLSYLTAWLFGGV